MIDFIAEIVSCIAELAMDLLIEPWIGKLWKNRKEKKRRNIGSQTGNSNIAGTKQTIPWDGENG